AARAGTPLRSPRGQPRPGADRAMKTPTSLLQAAACAACIAFATPAQAQFGNILRQLPGNIGIPGMTPAAPATSAGGGDLFQLLQQSVESIDEPKEIEIGRQLAAVLL